MPSEELLDISEEECCEGEDFDDICIYVNNLPDGFEPSTGLSLFSIRCPDGPDPDIPECDLGNLDISDI